MDKVQRVGKERTSADASPEEVRASTLAKGQHAQAGEWTRRSEFVRGVQLTLPLLLGATPFGLVFGAIAITSGMTGAAAAWMSALVYAGASQLIAAGLVSAGAGVAIIVLTTFVVNLRHALYSASLGPFVRSLPQRWLLPMGFLLTDETFFVAIRRYQQNDASPHKHWFYLGSGISMYLNWQFWTWVGILAGRSIPDPQAWGLDVALPVTFIGMLIPGIVSRSILITVIAGAVGSLVFAGLPNRLGLLAASLLAVVLGLLASRFDKSGAQPAGVEIASTATEAMP